jgi:hypothetical protein
MRRRLENPFSTRATWDTWFDMVSVPGSTLKSRRVGFLISVRTSLATHETDHFRTSALSSTNSTYENLRGTPLLMNS